MEGEICLIKYICEGDIKKIKERIDKCPEEVDKRDPKNRYTAIVYLYYCENGDERTMPLNIRIEILKLLLQTCPDLNYSIDNENKSIFTKLIESSTITHREIKMMLEYDAYILMCDGSGTDYFDPEYVTSNFQKLQIIEDYKMNRKVDDAMSKIDKIMEELRAIRNEIRELRYQPGNVGFFEAKKHFADMENKTTGKKK